MEKTYEDINSKINDKTAVILTAEEMVSLVEKEGVEYAAEAVDVVTTGTFGCMCSSGVFFNLPQPDPPIKIETIEIDGVNAYHGNAAADCYLGVTQGSRFSDKIGGGHVLEKLVKGENVSIHSTGTGTDCYPRKSFDVSFGLQDFNQAVMINPRNAYQKYVCAVNSSEKTLYTYMGKLLPKYQNATYGGVGTISPLHNDPSYQTIGVGTPIFLGGTVGHIIGPGTQHNPESEWGNIMVSGDLKKMVPEFIAGAFLKGYGYSCYIGLGIPIPILNESLARTTGTPDTEIFTSVLDYSTGKRERPFIRRISYAELKTRQIEIEGKMVPVSSTSSYSKARKITKILKMMIEEKKFPIVKPIQNLPTKQSFKTYQSEDA
ncbi:homocysteine biosynthesis protein [Candidatus Harpocratesius sp.]